ncbi:peptide chain release factor 3 [Acidiphilium sp. AL]|uniref:Peptide chain release factor 3 n=1 Tax=Acidiphilium iwatense TaxID=768198 RepID=A0ABS9DXJ6_9PROT|nr:MULTISPECIES: peptide chain release factor 3 [Acidiphilium]MCF3946525.1 peptide chain release factor 3 [Acidiphilium iwatense]MCU4160426.1 peptide chain release factor 3 [Acidiphilium sp. AL]
MMDDLALIAAPAETVVSPLPRRTFAIISHPDAGKTTLTEKLLLFGGAIHEAGMVKARRERRNTRSDWMAIERQRGISVTSSVMTFTWRDVVFNLLDTPGHQDFSEDTYRTLTAVDAAVMVIDAARGIEAQTLKLFEVCRLRDIPIVTFINKIDREGLDPFALLDEIAGTLALDVTPLLWPVGMGGLFRGCWDIAGNRPIGQQAPDGGPAQPVDIPPEQLTELREAIELAGAGYPSFDETAFRAGHLTPVLFGSALKDYGVAELLAMLADCAPAPSVQRAEPHPVAADDPAVTGFVFKVQANMDPNHRDRIAFTRICSGRFQRGMKLFHVRAGKTMAVQAPIFFFARDRSLAEEAYPGDIIGIPNHGSLRVGDTLTEGEMLRFTGIPSFAPEILRRIVLADPMRAKQLRRALEDLAEEGVAQIFRPMLGADWIVGVVGALQLDVLAARIDAEYKIPIRFETAPYATARWVNCDDARRLKEFVDANQASMGLDRDDSPVFLARDSWSLRFATERWPEIRFSATHEQAVT